MVETTDLSSHEGGAPHTRGAVLRDVLVLQFKLLAVNIHNLIPGPVTLATACVDLVFTPGKHGGHFYRALDWGRRAERAIGVYDSLGPEDAQAPPGFAASVLADRLKIAISKELERDGTVVSMASVVDRVFEQLRQEQI